MSNASSTIQVIHLLPDDVIVASHSGQLNTDQLTKVEKSILACFPDHKVLVHDSRVSLSIHRQPSRQ